ncbi:hypothetical protein BCAR13_180004 [Paraburkholderia caribensis]|nr:hypothetical protein BCAR13_180004 [Paraburkholderia caribensis]
MPVKSRRHRLVSFRIGALFLSVNPMFMQRIVHYRIHARVNAELLIIKVCYHEDSPSLIHPP